MDRAYFEVLAILLLILANGFFAASEFALIAASRSRLKNWARKGDKRAAHARDLLTHPEKFLATIQVGITFVATLAGVFGGATLVPYLVPVIRQVPIDFVRRSAEPIAIVSVVVIISFLTLIVGELIPKYIALAAPEKISMHVARPIALFSRLSFFLVAFLTVLTKAILRFFGMPRIRERTSLTEEEINILISEGAEKGVFDPTEQELIKSVFEFTDITVRKAMTPRVEMKSLRMDWPKEQILEFITTNGYSRYPVYKDSIDDITGIVYTKDLLPRLLRRDAIVLKEIARKPLFVPDSMPLTILLRRFQKRKVHIAVVLDEFGGTAGLITLEDILEEIVGEIQDEHDNDQPDFVAHSETTAYAAATLRPDELNDAFGLHLPTEEADTIGGFIMGRLSGRPRVGGEITADNVNYKIIEMEGPRIKRIEIRKL